MKEGLIWVVGSTFQDNFSAIKSHEMQGHFKIKAVISNEQSYTYDYKDISKEDVKVEDYDFVIIKANGETLKNILPEVLNIGFKKEHIIISNVVNHPLFDINKYLEILKTKPTLFSNMCFGGYLYNNMGLEFSSPLINMYFHDNDYIKFLKSPKFYLNQKLKLQDWKYNPDLKINFPVVSCGDILLNFNHTNDFESVKTVWKRRKERINWDNIIYMMHTDRPDIEEQFNNLPYKKKICFVPYETNKEYSLYVDLKVENMTFARIINRISDGTFLYYNPFDLLLTGIAKKI